MYSRTKKEIKFLITQKGGDAISKALNLKLGGYNARQQGKLVGDFRVKFQRISVG